MASMKRIWPWVFICLFFSQLPLLSYQNENAHRKINELAFKRFVDNAKNNPWKEDPIFKYYDFKESVFKLSGEAVVQSGFFYPDETYKGMFAGNIAVGTKELLFPAWIEEGGYSADEPEFYSSLRHFYDPKAKSQGKTYLTDHVNEWIEYLAGKLITDPQMDAREWAITGPARNGYAANAYSWEKGREYMEKAFLAKGEDKIKLFAAAWRSLGETMHLLADMAQPAHVRNDAHPFNTNMTGFKLDPYEYFVCINSPGLGDVITPAAKNELPEKTKDLINGTEDIGELFHRVASFTNENYFSADTVSGKDPDSDQHVTNGNGMPEYPSPKLDNCTKDPLGFYECAGRKLAHWDWAHNTWWNATNASRQWISRFLNWTKAIDTYQDVCVDEAQSLIPLAIFSCARLVDWFIPRLEVLTTDFDAGQRILHGTVVHTTRGPYIRSMKFNKGPKGWSQLTVNGRLYSEVMEEYELDIQDGSITCKMGDKIQLNPDGKNKFELKLFFGGFWVTSKESDLCQNLMDTLHAQKYVTVMYEGGLHKRIDPETSNPGYVVIGNLHWVCSNKYLSARPAIQWKDPLQFEFIYQGQDQDEENTNYDVRLAGKISADGRKIENLTYSQIKKRKINDQSGDYESDEGLTLTAIPLNEAKFSTNCILRYELQGGAEMKERLKDLKQDTYWGVPRQKAYYEETYWDSPKSNHSITITFEKDEPVSLTVAPKEITEGEMNREYTFTSVLANVPAAAKKIRYEWQFDDGSPLQVTEKNSATHTFAKMGVFSLRVAALDNTGANPVSLKEASIRIEIGKKTDRMLKWLHKCFIARIDVRGKINLDTRGLQSFKFPDNGFNDPKEWKWEGNSFRYAPVSAGGTFDKNLEIRGSISDDGQSVSLTATLARKSSELPLEWTDKVQLELKAIPFQSVEMFNYEYPDKEDMPFVGKAYVAALYSLDCAAVSPCPWNDHVKITYEYNETQYNVENNKRTGIKGSNKQSLQGIEMGQILVYFQKLPQFISDYYKD